MTIVQIAIVYYSGSGITNSVAKLIAQGVEAFPENSCHLLRIQPEQVVNGRWKSDEILTKLSHSDGIIFGSPTYMGSVASQFKAFMDATSELWVSRQWKNKIAAGFTCCSSPAGDNLNSLIQLAVFAAQHGMLWVGQEEVPEKYVSGGNADEVGRCPHRCLGSQQIPFDVVLTIHAYQQTSTELMRLGCLLTVFLPFDLAARLLLQLTGIAVSDEPIWNWVQVAGQRAMETLRLQLQHLAKGQLPQVESLDVMLEAMPLIIAADGVTVPFRPHAKTPKGKIVWREVKVAILARLGQHQTKTGESVTRLHRRRLVAVLGDIDALKPRLQLEAFRQGMNTAAQVVWISDGARGFWRLYQQCFAHCAVGILDFYHAVQHLWQAATAYQDGNPARTPQMWFARMRHQLRHGFGKRIIKELDWLSKSKNTTDTTKPVLHQVRDYLSTHLAHIQYRSFNKMRLPIGSGMIESACKWLIQQRFKGVGMRWSEDGFNHLLHLRLAWVNQRFDSLFSDESLVLTLYSPKP